MTWACPRCLEQQEQGETEASHGETEDNQPAKAVFEALQEEEEEEASNHEMSASAEKVVSQHPEEMDKTVDDPLSVTAQLEALHGKECGEDDSFLFAKPLLPSRGPTQKTKLELNCLPGKNWRRSMAVAKKTLTPQKKAPRVSFIVVPTKPEKLNKVTEAISEYPEIEDLAGEDQEQEVAGDVAAPPRLSLSQLFGRCSLSQGESPPDQTPSTIVS